MSRLWRVRNSEIPLDRPLIMGVVNTTPDSFSDGGRLPDTVAAVSHALELSAAGADIIDIGGESTRPGAESVGVADELDRTLPVVARLAELGVLVSIDTMKPEVARDALDAGAVIVNDVGGMALPDMRQVVAESGAGVVVVHMQGTPRTMQDNPTYGDVVGEVIGFFRERCSDLIEAGTNPGSIVVDPGIGFGKTMEHNLALLNRLGEFEGLGFPLMIGASRKRFLGQLTGRDLPADRDFASAVAAAAAVVRGARIVRVHDAALSLEAVQVAWAIVREEGAPWASVAAEGVVNP